MKKNTFFLLFIFFGYLSSFGQIGISENFDNGVPADWTSSFFTSATQACEAESARDNLYSFSDTGNLTSPNIVGQSNATDLTVSFDYKIVDYSDSSLGTAEGWGSFTIDYSTDGGATWINIDTIDDSNHVTSSDCATMTYTVAAADLPTGSDFQLRFDIVWAAGDYYVYYDNVSALQTTENPPNCDAMLVEPEDEAADVAVETNITWNQASGIPSGYLLSIGTTSGGTDVLDNEDLGYTNFYDPASNLLYEQEYFVTIVPYNENGEATGCEEQNFTTESAPPQGSLCEDAIPVTEPLPYVTSDSTSNYEDDYSGSAGVDCSSSSSYLNGDDVVYEYTPTEDTSVDIILSDLSGTYAGMFIYSNCEDIGVECQNGITNGSSSADMEIAEYLVTGGETYYILISTWASPQSVDYTLTISENTCINPTVDFEVVGNCSEGAEFFVEVDVTDIGSAGDLDISDGTTTQTISTPDVLSFGPFSNGTDVNITVNNNQDANCFVNSPALTQEFCTETYIDCSTDGPLNVNYCYGNDEDYEVTYVSTDGTPLNLILNGGFLESCCDEFIVLDTDGTELFNSGGDISGNSFQSTGGEITVIIDSDGSVNCGGNDYDPIDYTVSCATCINPQVEYFKECDPTNQQFSITVELIDLGSATSIEIVDDQGSASETLTATGMVTFGPFSYDSDVVITTQNLDDINCALISPVINSDSCPPIPCLEAEPFCSDEGLLFENVDDSSNTTAPPGIDYGCLASQPNPVWYFMQIDTPGSLSLDIVQNTSFDDDGNPNGTGLDVDFIAWGPFESVESACNGLTVANQVQDNPFGDGCSFSAAPEETFGIENAQAGDIYVLLITNYNGDPGLISVTQSAGDGTTDCSIVNEEVVYGCEGDTVDLVSEYQNGLAYVWYLFNENTQEFEFISEGNENDPSTLTVSEEGIYQLETFDQVGNSLPKEQFTVVFSSSPIVDLGPDDSFCDASGILLDATPTNASEFGPDVEYIWYLDGVELTGETNATITVAEEGTYSVEVIGTVLDDAGNPVEETTCAGTDEVILTEDNVTVSVDVIEGQLVDNVQFCPNTGETASTSITFEAVVEGISLDEISYQWYNDGAEIADATESTYTPIFEGEGLYTNEIYVEVISGNCVFTSMINAVNIEISSYENGCVISQGISPSNVDGFNDCLDLTFLDDRTGIESLKVYNRYGRLVFERDNYVNSFCGQDINGDELPSGTYYYVLVLEGEDPVFGRMKKSWVYINREAN